MARLLRVILFVKDVQRMADFYRDAIGLVPATDVEASDDWVPLDGEGCQLALHRIPPRHASGVTIEDPAEARVRVPVKICFHDARPLAAREVLIGRGVRMREPTFLGELVLCDGIDPEGNVFQISNR